jgi:hypothetical protein
MEQQWNDTDSEKPKDFHKNLSQCHFVHVYSLLSVVYCWASELWHDFMNSYLRTLNTD